MEDEEIIDYLKKDKSNSNFHTCAMINVLTNAMIQKGWFTGKEFDECVDKSLDNLLKAAIKDLPKEDRESLETAIKIKKDALFGNLFDKLL